MTRILIVDDEIVFCDYLKSLINWEDHGYIICATASNGLEAKEKMKLTDPDIVITDIQMPEVNGLSLISYININFPHVQTIALSGYDEYQYVRSSLRNGVVDYLLKHQTNAQTLLSAVDVAKSRLNSNRKTEIDKRNQDVQIVKGKMALKRTFLANLLAGNLNKKEEIIEFTKKLGLAFKCDYFVIASADIDNMSHYKEKYSDNEWYIFFNRIMDIVETIASQNGGSLVLPQYESRFTILFYMENTCSLLQFYNHVNSCIQQIRSSLKNHCNITATYSVSANICGLAGIPARYEKTCSTLDNKIFHENDVVLNEEKEKKPFENDTQYSITPKEEQEIIKLFRSNEKEKLRTLIESIFENCRTNHVLPERIQIVFSTLVNILTRLARMEHLDVTEIKGFNKLFEHYRYMKLTEMKEYIIDCYCFAMDKRNSMLDTSSSNHISKKACQIIERHFSDNISLSEIADELGVNPSYLSRKFKEDTGQTVVEYLNAIRINHAKRMILDGAKLTDLAEQVGFNSNTYFFTVFKQITGKTPLQYKKDSV